MAVSPYMRCAVVVGVLLAVGCSDDSDGLVAVDIVSVNVVGEREWGVSIASCNAEAFQVEVEETADSVVLRGFADGGQGGDECSDGQGVTLTQPLGDRTLVDG